MDYEVYVNRYGGQAVSREEWPALSARAEELLRQYKRDFRVEEDPEGEAMAVCAMAETLGFYAAARSGQGGLRYAAVGTVSVSGKGVYAQMDISPGEESRELYRCARRYLRIYRGRGG